MRPMRAAILAATLAAAGAGMFSGVATADPAAPNPPAPPVAPDPNTSPAPAGALATSIDHDGTFVVGKDIAPGTYASAGPVGDGACYWKRIGDDQNPIIDNAMTKKPQTVAIEPTDKAFKTSGCQAWTLTDAPADAQPAGGLSALIAGAQLRGWLNTVNNGARQYDGSQVPTP
ncbi:hypothetical protein [Mycobacterium sp. 155]|uniref:hypothetical protein n=1 Tax=Mycobacterium sp. 155 TaxID=1157943 RepID=UPI0004764CF0